MTVDHVLTRFADLAFHDAVLNRVVLDFVGLTAAIEVAYIVDSVQESDGAFRATYRDAKLTLLGVFRFTVEGEWDAVNRHVILDLDLVENSEDLRKSRKDTGLADLVEFRIATTSNVTMQIICRDFGFEWIEATRHQHAD